MQAIILMMGVMFLFSSSSWWMVVLCGVGMMVFFVVNLIMKQESMLYVPCVMTGMQTPRDNPEGYRSPAEKGLEFEDVWLKTSDGLKIHAWFISAGKEKVQNAPTILFCHANAGNIGLRLPNFASIVERLEANIFALDYRGYGFSEGSPSEEGLIEDALAAWKWLNEAAKADRINGQKVFVFGRSLGGAVAIALSSSLLGQGNPLPCGMILENTFASIPLLVDSLFPFLAFGKLKDHFLRLRWMSVNRIADLEVPLLFLSGQKDEIVPSFHMQALGSAAVKSPLMRVLKVEDGMHNDTWEKGGEAYWEAQLSFVKHCCETKYPRTVAALACAPGGAAIAKDEAEVVE